MSTFDDRISALVRRRAEKTDREDEFRDSFAREIRAKIMPLLNRLAEHEGLIGLGYDISIHRPETGDEAFRLVVGDNSLSYTPDVDRQCIVRESTKGPRETLIRLAQLDQDHEEEAIYGFLATALGLT